MCELGKIENKRTLTVCQTYISQHPVGDDVVNYILLHFLPLSPSSLYPKPLTQHSDLQRKTVLNQIAVSSNHLL